MASSSTPSPSRASEIPLPFIVAAPTEIVTTFVKIGLEAKESLVLPQVLISLSSFPPYSSFNDPHLELGPTLVSDRPSFHDPFFHSVKEDEMLLYQSFSFGWGNNYALSNSLRKWP